MRYRNKLGRFSRKPKSETLSKNLFGSPGSSTSSVKMEGPHEIEQENQNNVLNLLPPPPPPARTLQTYLHPARNTIPSCILLPPNMPNIDFRPGMVQILPEFHGLENENPYVHVRAFEEAVIVFYNQIQGMDFVKLKFFPFSLKGKAKAWLYSLGARSIGSWAEMIEAFLNEYFPNHKTMALKKKIANFAQNENESLYQTWKRFKELLSSCPHHGFETWRQASYFYEGLLPRDRQFIESMCNGNFMKKDPDEAIEFLNEIAEKAHQWSGPSQLESTDRSKPSTSSTAKGIYQLKDEDYWKMKYESLMADLNLNKTGHQSDCNQVCEFCYEIGHSSQTCPALQVISQPQVAAVGNFQRQYNSYPEAYNQAPRNQPNFRWRNESNPQVSAPNPQFSAPNAFNSKPSLSDTLQAFMQEQQKQNEKYHSLFGQLVEENKEIKNQISKLTNSLTINEKGKFPSSTEPNPKGINSLETFEHADSITLKSGKIIENTPPAKEVEKPKSKEKVDVSKETEIAEKYHVPAPFPKALLPLKKENKNAEILDLFKQVKINIPLLDAIKQVPSYAKFLKDLCTVKRKHNVKKTAFLAAHVSSVLQNKIPPKYKDPGSPTLSCVIGEHFIDRALLDLGASVNLLPYSVYLQLGLGELKPTRLKLQLADRSIKIPRGIIENVLVQVDKFYYPVDFVVLDTAPVSYSENTIPVILGRPFLATCDANISCKSGVMKLIFGNLTMEVNIFNVFRQPYGDSECEFVDFIGTLMHEQFVKSNIVDALENFLVNSHDSSTFENAEIAEISSFLDSFQVQEVNEWTTKFEKLPPRVEPKPSSVEVPKLELKPLPADLKYAFLGLNDTFPVVISSKLNSEQEGMLLNVLNAHKSAIGC